MSRASPERRLLLDQGAALVKRLEENRLPTHLEGCCNAHPKMVEQSNLHGDALAWLLRFRVQKERACMTEKPPAIRLGHLELPATLVGVGLWRGIVAVALLQLISLRYGYDLVGTVLKLMTP